jgi:hypothetical protein
MDLPEVSIGKHIQRASALQLARKRAAPIAISDRLGCHRHPALMEDQTSAV